MANSWIWPSFHITGLNSNFWGDPQSGSGVVFSANPTTSPRLLIWLTAALLPVRSGSCSTAPLRHRNGRQVCGVSEPEQYGHDGELARSTVKPQKSSPLGLGSRVSD